MRRPSPLPDDMGGRAFSVSEARRLGVSRQRTRSAELQIPYFGVRAPSTPTTTLEHASAYAQWMSPHHFFSHLTAAELVGLRVPEGYRPGALHVSALPPARAPRGRQIIGHQLSPQTAPLTLDGLRVAGAIDTWLSLGATLPVDDLIILGDGLMSRIRPLAHSAAIHDALVDFGGRRGHKPLARAFHQMRPHTDAARETMLRLLLTRAGFP